MKVAYFLVLSIVVFTTASTSAVTNSKRLAFKGIAIGTEIGSLTEASGLVCKQPSDVASTKVCLFRPAAGSKYSTFVGQKVKYVLMQVHENKIVRLFVSTGSSDGHVYDQILAALTTKYGSPAELKTRETQWSTMWASEDIKTYTRVSGNRYDKYRNPMQWSDGQEYMLFGSIAPAESIRLVSDPSWRFGFRPHKFTNIRPTYQIGLLIVAKSAYHSAMKAHLDDNARKATDDRLKQQNRAVQDL